MLTHSPLNLPVEFALCRSLAEKVNLRPPSATSALLPNFVTLKVTLSAPTSEVNQLAFGGSWRMSRCKYIAPLKNSAI